MKAVTALILVCIVVSVLITASPTLAYAETSVGVKEGDWIEYNISVTGTGALPPTHDVRWMRIDVLQVQGAAFSVNLTARYANGTIGSAVWKFNFTEGNVGGWIIIPSNLGPGDTFYDSSIHTGKPVNVTIQSQEQKTVLGASRTITRANDSIRLVKEWDKATGVFIYSVEHPKNLTVTTNAIATNMWSAQILEVNHTPFYALVTVGIVLAVLIPSSLVLVARRKRMQRPSQGKIAALTVLTVILLEVGFMTLFPFYALGLSMAELNLIIQTFLTGLVFVSMWFRVKGNYFVHELTMLVVMCVLLVGFSAVLLMDPFSGGSSQVLSSSPLRWVMNGLHGIFSIPALVFGGWLVALWRPESTTFAAKSKRIAQLTIVFWVPSYVVGVLDFLVLHTTFFG